MIKILIIKNRYTKKLNLEKGLNWFKEKAGIDVSVTQLNTDFDLSFGNVGNNTYSGVVATGYYPELYKVAKEGNFNCVVLYYGNKAPGIRVSYSEPVPLYEDTDVIQVVKDDNGMTLNHELFHSFFTKLRRKGINLYDPMDIALVNGVPKPYFNDKNLTIEPSNRTIALEALKPHWGLIQFINPPNTIVNIIKKIFAPVKGYMYFSEAEVAKWKLDPKLFSLLDQMRGIAGVPFNITSGFRTVEQNKNAGGKANSAHLRGLAVDLACTDNFTRSAMLEGILRFKKDIFLEIAQSHLHIDIDSSIHQMGQVMVSIDD